jgi:hypothetical protein
MSESQLPVPAAAPQPKWVLVLGGLGVFGLALAGVFLYLFLGCLGCEGPGIVEQLKAGTIDVRDVVSVTYFKPTAGWDAFSESEYQALPHTTLTDEHHLQALLTMLHVDTTAERTPLNHPGIWHRGVLCVTTKDEAKFYVTYGVFSDGSPKSPLVSLDSLAKNARNPNCSEHFESRGLVTFLEKHDPWYGDR